MSHFSTIFFLAGLLNALPTHAGWYEHHCRQLGRVLAVETRLIKPAPSSRYITDPLYAPVRTQRTIGSLNVLGKIPENLEGAYLRVGPNPKFQPIDRHHWFDGDGMIHGVRIISGEATYFNMYIETDALKEQRYLHGQNRTGLIQPLTANNLWAAWLGEDLLANTSNTALVNHHGRIWTTHYGNGVGYELDPNSFATVGKMHIEGKPLQMVAHTKVDPRTGELLFLQSSPWTREVRSVSVSPEGKIAHVDVTELKKPLLMHDLAFTKKHVLLFDMPMKRTPATEDIRHVAPDHDAQARIGLLSRDGSNLVRWIEVPPAVILHAVNASEVDGKVILYAADLQPNEFHGHLTEWVLDPSTRTAISRKIDDRPMEFPRINDQRLGQTSAIAYVPRLPQGAETFKFEAISKVNLVTGISIDFTFDRGNYGSEPVFVPRPGATSEDDGHLLTLVSDPYNQTAYLLILDASHWVEVGRVQIPTRVPLGFHALWAPKQDE